MKQINLNSTIRTQIGGNSAKRYRKSGQIPAVIYGESGEKNLLIEEKSLVAALKQVAGKAVLIELAFSDGTESRYAMIKDTARNPSRAPSNTLTLSKSSGASQCMRFFRSTSPAKPTASRTKTASSKSTSTKSV